MFSALKKLCIDNAFRQTHNVKDNALASPSHRQRYLATAPPLLFIEAFSNSVILFLTVRKMMKFISSSKLLLLQPLLCDMLILLI